MSSNRTGPTPSNRRRRTTSATAGPLRRRLVLPLVVAALVTGPLTLGAAAADAAVTATDLRAADSPTCPWMNTRASAERRARLLLDASTLDQKLRWLDEQAANSPTQTTFNGISYPVQVACTPTVVYSDGPDSVRNPGGVTAFPAPIAQAAAWDADLARRKGDALADEAYAKGRNVLLAPGVASGRTPQSGRTPEYLGEDTLLAGTLAAAGVQGIQQDSRVAATLKHYVANEQELDRQTSSSNLDERTFQEVYSKPFEIALAESDPASVMCSYNQVNGVYACENEMLDQLKANTGWDGYVMSDFGSVHSTAASLTAGLDQELNRPIYFTPAAIKAALAEGSITEKDIDDAALRVVRTYIRAGLFDNPLPEEPTEDASTPAHRRIALQVAEQGSVLLRNEGSILPLKNRKQSIAVIGATASNEPNTDGISAATVCSMLFRISPAVTCDPVSVLDGITERAEQGGSSVVFENGDDIPAAVAAAQDADVVIAVGYSGMGEFADDDLRLDGNADELITAVAAANPNTVVVLQTGSAVLMPWQQQVAGIVETWYPGQQQGNSLAALLWGDVNFTGRLPMTFPASADDLPTATTEQYPGVVEDGIRQVDYTEGLAVGYKWYDSQNIEPLYEFGHGLSYTTFDYDRLRVSTSGRSGHRTIKVTYRVRNTGARTGTETSQVYLTMPTSADEPGKKLAGFDQVTLKPGSSRTVSVTIRESATDRPLSVWDSAKHRWRTVQGQYRIQVGSSSRDLPLGTGVRIG